MVETLLAGSIADRARDQPDRVALICAEREVTYRELDVLAGAFAGLVRDSGVRRGDRIVYLGRNSEEYFPVLLGAVRAEAVLVPLNWRLAEKELHRQLDDASPAMVIADDVDRPIIDGWLQQRGREVPVLLTASEAGEVGDDEGWLLTALRARGSEPSAIPRDPDQIVLVLYTGGTTGRPKGVMLSHGALSEAVRAFAESGVFQDKEEGDVLVSPLHVFHSGGSVWPLIGLRLGLTNVIVADQSPQHMLEINLRHAPAYTYTVPTVLRRFIEEVRERGDAGWSLKAIGYGAGGSDRAFLKEVFEVLGTRLLSTYGLTELSGAVTHIAWASREDIEADRGASVGRAMPGYELEIRDAEGEPAPPGVGGEIWIRSRTMFSGYLNHPEGATMELDGGWYRTGDGGYLDEQGYLYLTDRIKDMIVSGGENVYPAEVEMALRTHPAVYDAAVVGVPDAEWGEKVVAFVELHPEASAPSERELRDAVRESLAAYKAPKSVWVIDELPRTAQGKVQRHHLRERAMSESSR